ncbi:methylthioribose-1-phosphate isomerase [Saccharopolyspora sp. HNM0983]|uniref:Methylthioribose-1-phosphate isomerase n=1 Tax=Saccharopolyspora montiporae TaxID=2781240 RepID=A0A929G2T2_9PSEU|nr:methylthioribose-1-phosphate isomerase [Saccharopolyspora sp. HNM0983]MBE9376148.1 methylthioribose-1-phosphate isomerase [Saccharopolyspora sp. HNM0983]
MPPLADDALLPTLADSVRPDEDGVHILDRRAFPFQQHWVHARTVDDVATAIEDMVTQSSGPYFAVLWGMVLAARDAAHRPDPHTHMHHAAARLVRTRPTNDQPRIATEHVLRATADCAAADLPGIAETAAREAEREYRDRSARMGRAAADLLDDDARVLTHCWGDLYLVGLVHAAQQQGKHLSFVCTETRPYLQGARLTAHTLAELDVPTTLVTDAMPAALLRAGDIDALVTASDRISMDGHVINKIGTLQLAVAAHTFGVPFHALCHAPDPDSPTGADVPIEFRDGDEVLHALGHRTASPLVEGRYPAFDVTDPRFVTTVVTDRGAYPPGDLAGYWTAQPQQHRQGTPQ